MPRANAAMSAQHREKHIFVEESVALMKIIGVIFACTIVGFATAKFDNESATMIYMVGIIYIALTNVLWKSLLASVLSVLAFDFFIVPPEFSFVPENTHYLFTYAIMLAVSFLTSYLFNRYSLAMDTMRYQSDLIDLTSDAIIEWDIASRKVKFWNKGAEQMFAISAHEACERKVSDVLKIPEELNDEVVENVLKNGFFNSDRSYAQSASGKLTVSSRWAFKAGNAKTPSSIIEFSTDISEKKRAEKRVKEFYSTVSHELRTPLTSIKAALGLLENSVVVPDSVNGKKLIVLARSQSDHLHNLINDILDLQKIESGHMQLNKVVVELSEIIAKVINELAVTAEAANVVMFQESEIKYLVEADRGKIEQVLTNLVGNAIKFSNPQSEIRIYTEVKNDRVRVSVTDNGPGIPQDQVHKIFEKFQQVDQTDTRSHGGTGLGLAISKAIIEQHKGIIGVDTRYGIGSTFWFELDAHVADDACTLPL